MFFCCHSFTTVHFTVYVSKSKLISVGRNDHLERKDQSLKLLKIIPLYLVSSSLLTSAFRSHYNLEKLETSCPPEIIFRQNFVVIGIQTLSNLLKKMIFCAIESISLLIWISVVCNPDSSFYFILSQSKEKT